jgi:hypothetical protein
MAKIKVNIECENIAPLVMLKEKVEAGSLKYGVFANNGSGKTFISRMFRLTEKDEEHEIDDLGKSTTDKLITRGKQNANFNFKITDNAGDIKEDISIKLQRGALPTIPETQYIYHTFNQDYVEQNIRTLNFEKDSDIQGFILGKINIDLNDEEEKLKAKKLQNEQLSNQVAREIDTFVNSNIKPIKNISGIKNFKQLEVKEIYKGIELEPITVQKSLDELIEDHNKVKSIPETLALLKELELITINSKFVESVVADCKEEFVLSDIAKEFKDKVKSKQPFIETGLSLLDEDQCPFCEQKLEDSALDLIDQYNKYLQDKEALTLKKFEGYQKEINAIRDYLGKSVDVIEKRILEYDSYKNKYLPSLAANEISNIEISDIEVELNELEILIEEQQKNISKSVVVEKDYISSFAKLISIINNTIEDNNSLLREINTKIKRISEESLVIRREICNAAFNYLVSEHKANFQSITTLRTEIREIENEIRVKKQQQKISKKDQMSETIKGVLSNFFGDKYSLDSDTFRLTFNNDVLEEKEANHVLSDGEKTIVAFAYYIGDVHLKVSTEDDYEKLFFIVDDPISSMDFDHVYTLCGVLRDLKLILTKLGAERLFVFTHNSEFMRVLTHHRIINKKLILKRGKLHDYSVNSTVPYINHLIDIYRVGKGLENPSHTTANSIRHIVETLTKFDRVILEGESIKNYISEKLPQDKRSCILINDLSHGGFRTEQSIISDEDYTLMCNDILHLVGQQFPGQIAYCDKIEQTVA